MTTYARHAPVEHERVLRDIRLWQRQGDVGARDRAFASVQRLIHKYAYRNPSPYMETADMEQNLSLVVLDCLDKFNPNAGIRFATYVTRALTSRAFRYRVEARMIYVPEGVVAATMRRNRGYTVTPDPKTGASITSITMRGKPLTLRELERLPTTLPTCTLLDEPASGDGADLRQLAAWNRAKTPDCAGVAINRATLASAMATLTDRERTIVRRVHFDGATMEAAGGEFGLTKERARQILRDAYAKMRPLIATDYAVKEETNDEN